MTSAQYFTTITDRSIPLESLVKDSVYFVKSQGDVKIEIVARNVEGVILLFTEYESFLNEHVLHCFLIGKKKGSVFCSFARHV